MSNEPNAPRLGGMLRSQRRNKRMSLRDLSAETGVSLNTLSRVERGHIPDLKNFQRIVDWLGVPAEYFLVPDSGMIPTPEAIARHLRSDRYLSTEAAEKIVGAVEEMYREFTASRQALEVHLRSAKTLTPAAGMLLAEVLREMYANLDDS